MVQTNFQMIQKGKKRKKRLQQLIQIITNQNLTKVFIKIILYELESILYPMLESQSECCASFPAHQNSFKITPILIS